jgi:hypothetical protein
MPDIVILIVNKVEYSQQILTGALGLEFTQIHPVVANLFHAARWRDREKGTMKPMAAFYIFANAPKNQENTDMMTFF